MEVTRSKFSYQRLRHEVIFEDDDQTQGAKFSVSRPGNNWLINRLKRVHIRRKFRVKIAGFRKLFKIKILSRRPRVTWATKVLKRLKESQSHLGDLFSGNYLFMQITPASFNKSHNNSYANTFGYDHKLYAFPSRFNQYAIEKAR